MNLDQFEKKFCDVSGPCMYCKRINPFVTGGCIGCKTWGEIAALVIQNHIEKQAEKMSACSKQ